MAPFDELLKKCRRWALLDPPAAGPCYLPESSTTRSGGAEVVGWRDYAPGDDYRHVDWRLAARRDELLTRVFAREQDQYVYILLDCSPSMGLGTPPKIQLARHLAAVLGYLTLSRLGCLRLLTFSEGIVAETPPSRSKWDVATYWRFLEEMSLEGKRTSLARTAEALLHRPQPRGAAIVMSDLYDPDGFQRGFDMLRCGGYDLRVVQIHDPREADPTLRGDVELLDAETGAAHCAVITERTIGRYRERFAQFQDSVRRYCASHAVPCVQVAGDTPEDEVLRRVLTYGSYRDTADCV